MATGKKDEAGEEKLSDMELVRRTVNELGYDAKTQDIREQILAKFNRDLNPNKVSAYKSNLRRQAGVSKPRRGRPAGRPAAAARASASGHSSAGLRVEDVQTVQELVGRLGADKVRELVGVFHR